MYKRLQTAAPKVTVLRKTETSISIQQKLIHFIILGYTENSRIPNNLEKTKTALATYNVSITTIYNINLY